MDQRKLRNVIKEVMKELMDLITKQMQEQMNAVNASAQFMSDAFEEQKRPWKN